MLQRLFTPKRSFKKRKVLHVLAFTWVFKKHVYNIESFKRSRLLDTEDELSDIQSDSIPSEVRDWLASTFTRQMGMMLKRTEEKPRFRSIVHAVQAGIFVERYGKLP